MANMTLKFHQGGSVSRNLGVATVAHSSGEVEPDGAGNFMIYQYQTTIGREAAAALPDGGSVWLVPNPTYDANGNPATEDYAIDSEIYLTKTVPATAYNRDTNPYDTVESSSTANNTFLGLVERSCKRTDKYIQVRHLRNEFGS